MARAPKTLWWYLWRELARLLLLTAAVAVVVTSFAVAVKPLADGQLGPLDTLKFMALAAVPMLQYALPFAAGFAATIAYHRYAEDNELTASFAGGVSHRALLAPAALTGLVMAAGLFVLADQVMPRFLRRMGELVSEDVMRLMQNAFARGESVTLDGRNMFYADALIPREAPPGTWVTQHFALKGLVYAQVDEKGDVVSEVSSRYAAVWLGPGAVQTSAGGGRTGSTVVVMQLMDSIAELRNTHVPEAERMTIQRVVPVAFSDNPKYHTWAELEATKAAPERMDWIDADRRRLAERLAERETVERMNDELRQKGRATLLDATGKPVTLRARPLAPAKNEPGWALEPAGRERAIEIVAQPEEGRVRTIRARRGVLATTTSAEQGGSQYTLALEEVSLGEESGVVSEYRLNGLVPAADPLPRLLTLSAASLAEMAQQPARNGGAPGAGTDDGGLTKAGADLAKGIDLLRREITSKQHERVAASLACLVMVMTGAVMAMRLRESLPLTVYLWSFLPALGALFTIAGGQTMVHREGPIGFAVLYGGVALLAVWTYVEYRRVATH